ncbi:sigma-70 family RNA polymerase sigma factor [Streptococcus ratti]|uniref:Sigma-70 family RNA polymerase sigma factor n=2 Tax=Streptococcus ratti TaxID=1341 RepID=A0A7X9QHT7_STRRT|nr:sigma-70 family RNA polymerase sigma factor [Streptococcus ratti]VEI59296.1 ComX1, transcriptional regulator of competence-specific genes [Streptococcus mutans]EJN95039.1 putative ComX1, transcriptional regulator of competence-specific genes [Streptococcus ratti FA-1 = DSM 20564]EMP69611.1 putative ComX1 [Streptococcus ratti FA-1 = DSM 20564]NMD49540.1 sigma-70 family RNA polymerase sigma factor [Streptococcus ratti]QEY06879.1 sigma-70 family RNA polymerase sigma factor [Streptococcus ratti
MEEDFEIAFNKVKPIIFKLQRYYFIKLWTREDWQQEGMLVLHQLLKEHPELSKDDAKLYVYFKTRFSNYIKDVLRQQESQKRRFNKMPYDEISEVAHCVSNAGMQLDEYVLFYDRLTAYKKELDENQKEQFERLVAGERFLGRQKMLKELKKKLSDFDDTSLREQ